MESVIIYGSKYGSAKRYAEALSKKLNIDYLDYRTINRGKKYDVLIYVGSLYAGGVIGLKKTLNNYPSISDSKVFIITVGIADPNNTENVENIKNSLYKQLPKNLNKNIILFHLRGDLDYSKLNIKHKIMMKLVYEQAKKVPLVQQNEETKTFISTYNKKNEFINYDSLEQVVDRYLQIIKKHDV